MTSLFGSTASNQPKLGNLFGQSTTGQTQPTTSLFGQPQNQQSQQTGGLFGQSQNQQPQQTSSLFGQPQPQAQQPQPTGSLFNQPQANNAFGAPQPQAANNAAAPAQGGLKDIWGNPAPPLTAAPKPSLFGNTLGGGLGNNQPQQAGSLFAKPAPTNLFGGAAQNQQAQQQQQPQQIGSGAGQNYGNRIWNEQDIQPRELPPPSSSSLTFPNSH